MWRPDQEGLGETWVGCLSLVDLFTVYVAAIGHDVGHPGFSNVFMVSGVCAHGSGLTRTMSRKTRRRRFRRCTTTSLRWSRCTARCWCM